MTAVFRVLRFPWSRAAGLWRVAKRWISRFGMAVSGWYRPEKATKKLQKNCIFFWKKVLRRDFRAVDDLAKGATCSAALILFTDYGGSRSVCRMP
ncbi:MULTISPECIES: hypothetical protein [Rhizobium/Agrobacterium group]|uniref:hypothetical protein n=1 Tax=Rhizobium/Agrobacterium group TaxID=227290 RepID=UPI00179496DE|nr:MULTISPECIES: hypothetical protein [Rhizobium/Agrobacterium group]MBB4399476.1 hypothetical protein [Agrobacterium radiobacter]MBB5585630.1 hypothetical protein [Agrobacterium radiobacter]